MLSIDTGPSCLAFFRSSMVVIKFFFVLSFYQRICLKLFAKLVSVFKMVLATENGTDN